MKFAIYDFEMNIPSDWSVNLDRRSKYGSGNTAITTTNRGNMQMLWDNLDKYKEKYPSVEAYIDSYFERMQRNKSVKNFETSKGMLRSEEEHNVLPHEFSYTIRNTFGRTASRKVRGVLIYDNHSNRFAILYNSWDSAKENPDENAIKEVLRTFECRCNKATP